MKICICGLWHLGLVSAAGAATQFACTAFDFDSQLIERISRGELPIFEPGLAEQIEAGVRSGRLRFSSDAGDALRDADVVWIAWDTPVDESDRADVAFVAERVHQLAPYLRSDAIVLVSSQVPVGFCRSIEDDFRQNGVRASVAYSPENLQLGDALRGFSNAKRTVVGTRTPQDRRALETLFAPFAETVLSMSVESAEMTKHALNAFLATSLCFVDEVAALCERLGADVADVERALRADPRVGPKAYVSAGPGYAGGTLGRDVAALNALAERERLELPLIASIPRSNAIAAAWTQRRLLERLGDPSGKRIALLGLTYKPKTDTLRRSASVELARSLSMLGARISAYDPAIAELPENLRASIDLCDSIEGALRDADAAIVATEWEPFRSISAGMLCETMRRPLVLDPKRVLGGEVRADKRIDYHAIGLPERADA